VNFEKYVISLSLKLNFSIVSRILVMFTSQILLRVSFIDVVFKQLNMGRPSEWSCTAAPRRTGTEDMLISIHITEFSKINLP